MTTDSPWRDAPPPRSPPLNPARDNIRTWEGWLFLATVIDLASRRVVGWATADHLRTDLVEEALRHAVTTRRPPAKVIFHSDCAEPCVKPRDRVLGCACGFV